MECILVGRPEWSKPDEWANPSVMDYKGMSTSEIEEIKTIDGQLKSKLNVAVNEYVEDLEEEDNTDYEDPYEPYPNKFEMSGEYYINNASCSKVGSDFHYRFCIELLAKVEARTTQESETLDYHGLEILLIIDQTNNIQSDGVVSSWGS